MLLGSDAECRNKFGILNEGGGSVEFIRETEREDP